jgi:ribonucleoside-triphosphate reductase
MCYSLQGLSHYLSGALSQTYWLNSVCPSHIKDAHESGDLPIHDLNQLSVDCLGWELESLPKENFCGVSGKTEAYPPKHFRTAFGPTFSNFDILLVLFIK